MADYKKEFVSEVTTSLVNKIDHEDINIVADEMNIALKDYDLKKRVTDLVKYDGANELIVKRYKACLMIAGRSPKTILAYERTARILLQTIHKNYLDMNVSDLRYFLAYEKSRGISNRTLENTRVQISTFFSWLVEEELINKNPCKLIKPIRYEEKIRFPFSPVELDAIRGACKSKKERAIVELLLATGVRVSELCSICLSDINFETLSIKIRNGKGSKQRTVYMTELTKKYLFEYLESRNVNGDYLFYNKKKQPLNAGGVRYILKANEARTDVENIHPHRFRRTFATGLSNRGMEIQEIAKLLGHSDINTTLTYLYTSEEQIHNSYRKHIA